MVIEPTQDGPLFAIRIQHKGEPVKFRVLTRKEHKCPHAVLDRMREADWMSKDCCEQWGRFHLIDILGERQGPGNE